MAPSVICRNDHWMMLYRAYGKDRISRFGYAESKDGIDWFQDIEPRINPLHDNFEYSGIEDPRTTKLGDNYYTAYTAFAGKKKFRRTRVRFLKTDNFKDFTRIKPKVFKRWRGNDKDATLFPEKIDGYYVLLHRLEPSIGLSVSTNLIKWRKYINVLGPTENDWESVKVGAGPPPLRTSLGWLVFYHGVSPNKSYSMGAAILDIHDPTHVLYRLPYPLLSPEKDYEKNGAVNNVVFGTSAIEIDDGYRLYYGGADNVICAASINKKSLLEEIVKYPIKDTR